ncbi:MAG: OB-fold nucleic acid binding domain-containing protein, partial [bacterium]
FEAGVQRIIASRPFESVDDLSHRAALNRRDLECLAAADALASLVGHRRKAHWHAAGVEHASDMLSDAPVRETEPKLAAPEESENILADYASLGLTLGRHPLALLRTRLGRLGMLTAGQLYSLPHGHIARAAGLVTCRQRPDTVSGVIFLTLEDETGCVNVIVWRDLVERQRRELLGARLLGVQGVIEREGEVVHLVARRLFDYGKLLGCLIVHSRDFH